MTIRCPVCKEKRKNKIYILIPEGDYNQEIMYKGYCKKCKRDIIKLCSIRKNGDTERRAISNCTKFLQRRIVSYEELPLRNWRKAKGYTYFRGYRFKNSIKGAIVKLSNDGTEKRIESPLL